MSDYSDEVSITAFTRESVVISEQLAESRNKFAKAKFNLDIMLAKEFQKSESTIKPTAALEKCYIFLTNIYPEAKEMYQDYILEEQNYKGLESVLDARKGYVNWQQSIIKNGLKNA